MRWRIWRNNTRFLGCLFQSRPFDFYQLRHSGTSFSFGAFSHNIFSLQGHPFHLDSFFTILDVKDLEKALEIRLLGKTCPKTFSFRHCPNYANSFNTHLHASWIQHLIVVAQKAELDMAAGVLDTCKQMFFGPSNKT